MSIKRVGGSRDPGAALRTLATRIGSEKAELVLGAALVLEGAIKEKYSTPGRGRIRQSGTNQLGAGSYRTVKNKDGSTSLRRVKGGVPRTDISRADRASAPGDPPAPDSGNLLRSVTHEIDGTKVRVGTNVVYAPALEWGTLRILPRPAFRPALEESRDQMGEAVKAALNHLATSAGGDAPGATT